MESEDSSLKQQFQLLQERQLQRLQMRKLKDKEKDKEKDANGSARSTVSGTSLASCTGSEFGINDNLDLKLKDPSRMGTSYLSEELVEHLNNQIRELKDENGRLFRLLSEKDMEIHKMKKKKNDEKTRVMESQLTNETAATKIVELSKKIRELTAEMESERTKGKQFQRKCQELQAQLNMQTDKPADAQSVRSSKFGSVISLQSITGEIKPEGEEVDVKALQDKLKHTESKMAEYRNQCMMHKQEIKVAQKVLAQELGENVNIQSILNNASNFRGRAQQIIALQNKVDELKTQIEAMKPPSLEEEMLGNKSSKKRTQDDKYKDELRRLEKERKETQEREAAERKALEEEHHNLKQKLEAAKARSSALSRELKDVKKHLQVMVTKSDHDNDLIVAYEKQVERMTKLLKDINTEKTEAQRTKDEITKQLSQKSQQDTNVVNQLKAIVADREAKVKVLEQELEQAKNNYQATHTHPNQHPQYHQYHQPPLPQQNSFILSTDRSTPDTLQSQTPIITIPMSGQGFYSRQNTQLSSAGNTPPQSRQSHRPRSTHRERPSSIPRKTQSAGSARGQAMVAIHPGTTANNNHNRPPTNNHNNHVPEPNNSAVGELQYQCQELHTLLQATNVEKDRVSELLKIVQKRLSDETEAVNDLRSELLGVRRMNVEMEKQLGRIGLEKNAASGKKGKLSARGGPRDVIPEDQESTTVISGQSGGDVQELSTTIEIQKDEIDALKAALQRTLQAKHDDLALYSRTIDETKQVFLQALRQLKQSKLQT